MCGGGGGGGSPQPAPPQIQPRNPDLVRVSQRPERRELLDEDEVRTGVDYGEVVLCDTDEEMAKISDEYEIGRASCRERV